MDLIFNSFGDARPFTRGRPHHLDNSQELNGGLSSLTSERVMQSGPAPHSLFTSLMRHQHGFDAADTVPLRLIHPDT